MSATDTRSIYLARLKQALQEALQIELMTIPPYLCALWSIKNEMDPVALSIREVVQEEMMHLALVCNMLAALGEVPNLRGKVPDYPCRLPGGLHPNLDVTLGGLSKNALELFKQIEQPTVIIEHGDKISLQDSPATIGEFYERIGIAFRDLEPDLKVDRQIGGPLTETIITDVRAAVAATELIRHQGEGSKESPEDTGSDDLSHYYRFEELSLGRRIEYDPVKKKISLGAEITWPEVWPMETVPSGGYPLEDLLPEARDLMENFDRIYSRTINLLQSTWDGGGQADFLKAIQLMFELEVSAKKLMEIPVVQGSPGTLGPCFRYKPV